MSTRPDKRPKPGEKKLRDRVLHYGWRPDELIWLRDHFPDLSHELRALIDVRLRELEVARSTVTR
jgi:hypothetical protein